MTWKLFSNPRKARPRVNIYIKGEPELVECDILEEALALTNDVRHWPTGLKPSGRYWLRRRDTKQILLPRALPR